VRQQSARNLVPYLTASQVIDLPMSIAGTPRRVRAQRSDLLLEALGVTHCADRRPDQMSGGEQQRVAIGVALANQPRVLLADEPTAQLDSETGASVMALLRSLVVDSGTTAVVATHDPTVEQFADVVVHLDDGRLGHPTPSSAV
jgi:ABC-type lipoprotein export system ATPase subunit